MSALPDLPGRAFAYISHLLNLNFQILGPTPISTELMLAIFWEESPFFNNTFQVGGGTAVGFGQTEPAEFYRFDSKSSLSGLARLHGYLVHNLPRRVPLGEKRSRIITPLDDFTAVKVACAFVRDLYERGVRSRMGILKAYGGVGFKGQQPAHLAEPGGREAVIRGWLNCETALHKARPRMRPEDVMAALKMAKGFNREKEFRRILFPGRVVLEH